MSSVLIPKNQSYFFSSSSNNGAKNISADGSSFSVQLNNPIQFPRGAVGCTLETTQANVWNNSFNISAELENNIFRYHPGDAWIDVVIPDGQYSLSALNATLARAFVDNAFDEDYIIIGADEATQKTVLIFKFAGVLVDFTIANSCRNILGFDARQVPAVAEAAGYLEVSDDIARFNRITSYLIRSSLVSNGIPVNSTAAGIIASIPISVAPGSQIVYSPPHPIQADASELVGQIKNYFNFSLLDQEQRRVNTNGEVYTFVVVLRYYLLLSESTIPMLGM